MKSPNEQRLDEIDRHIIAVKAEARRRHGKHRRDWPPATRAEIAKLKNDAKAVRRLLGFRED